MTIKELIQGYRFLKLRLDILKDNMSLYKELDIPMNITELQKEIQLLETIINTIEAIEPGADVRKYKELIKDKGVS